MSHSIRAIQVEHDYQGTSGQVPKPLRVRLLGGFRVSVGDRIIEGSEWRLKKAANLIKLLALAPQHRLHRERVMELLWPGLLDPKAAANTTSTTRSTTPAGPWSPSG